MELMRPDRFFGVEKRKVYLEFLKIVLASINFPTEEYGVKSKKIIAIETPYGAIRSVSPKVLESIGDMLAEVGFEEELEVGGFVIPLIDIRLQDKAQTKRLAVYSLRIYGLKNLERLKKLGLVLKERQDVLEKAITASEMIGIVRGESLEYIADHGPAISQELGEKLVNYLEVRDYYYGKYRGMRKRNIDPLTYAVARGLGVFREMGLLDSVYEYGHLKKKRATLWTITGLGRKVALDTADYRELGNSIWLNRKK